MAEHEETYYFNSWGAASDAEWTDDANAVDGSTSTWAQCSTGNKFAYYDGNSCTTTQLGLITKVEFRGSGKVSNAGCSWCQVEHSLRYGVSWLVGNADIATTTAAWSAWADVTDDANAPASWTFAGISTSMSGAITCNQSTAGCGTVYSGRCELKVTWRDPMALYSTSDETVLCTDVIKVPSTTKQTETVTFTDTVSEIQIYLVRVLSYLEDVSHHFQLSLKVSSAQKTIFDSALKYAGRLSTFSKPFGDTETYDGTTQQLNTVGFDIINCPSGITNPLILVIDNCSSEIVTGSRFYLYSISGYKYV